MAITSENQKTVSSGSTKALKDTIQIPVNFQLDDDMATAFHTMEFMNETLFLTGRAGTGKSTLLNFFRKTTVKKYVVLAPTGLAALQVGGSTIHSFFGFPLRTLMKNDADIRPWSKGHPRLNIIKKMDTLIIDEVSMVRADVLDAIDQSLRLNTGNNIPFGGKQMVFIGDVFQLSPVVTAQDQTAIENSFEYESPYFFSADAFRECKPKILELKKIYRQHDDDFIYLLNRVRKGIANGDELAALNQRHGETSHDEDFTINLSSINATADTINQLKLMNLGSTGFLYKGKVEALFHERLYPSPAILKLKVGAQVMMIKNDLQGRWVNGSIGKVETLTDQEVKVRFSDGQIHLIEPVTWENKIYRWDKTTNTINFEVLGKYTQYPIRLAWAITIHKSQGLTFDKVNIDLGRGAFTHGQLYVALSRCKTLEGITLKTKIKATDMIVDEAVESFAGKCNIK